MLCCGQHWTAKMSGCQHAENIDRETGESVGSSVSSVPEECFQHVQNTDKPLHPDQHPLPKMSFGDCSLENSAPSHQATTTCSSKTDQETRRQFRIRRTIPGSRIDRETRLFPSSHDCSSNHPSVQSSADPQHHLGCVEKSQVCKSNKRTASSLVISTNRRRSTKFTSTSSTDSVPPVEPSPAKVAKLGLNSQRKDREAWVKHQKETTQKLLQANTHKQVFPQSPEPRSIPVSEVYMRQVRKQLKRLAANGEWEKATELIHRRFETYAGNYDQVLDKVMQEAAKQEAWDVVKQLVERGVGRHLLKTVFCDALSKRQWRWARKLMLNNSTDLRLNTLILHEAVKIAEDELLVLELVHDLNMECHADESFFQAMEKQFWQVASLMVRKQYVTLDQCREACEIVLLEAISHYKKGRQPDRKVSSEAGKNPRQISDQRKCTGMWSFLYLLAELWITREPILNYIQQALASNDWLFAKKLAYLVPVEAEDDKLPCLFPEAMRREDWPYIISRLSPSIKRTDDILHAAVAQGAWNYAQQIVGKTKKETLPDHFSHWSKLDTVLFLQQCCSEDVMMSAFRVSVRKADWEYVALLAHPSLKDKFRWAALQEILFQWAQLFFNLLMQGRQDSLKDDDKESVVAPSPLLCSVSGSPSATSFSWSPLPLSASAHQNPFSFNTSTPLFDQLKSQCLSFNQGDSGLLTCDSLNRSLFKGPSLSSERSESEARCSLDDVFLPDDASSNMPQFAWKAIGQNGQYLHSVIQLTQCLSKTRGSVSSNHHRELMKDVITQWARLVKKLLQDACIGDQFYDDDVCCTMMYTVEKKMEELTTTNATAETAWICVPVLVTQNINVDLAKFVLGQTLSNGRWDILQDVLLFGLQSFAEDGRRLIFSEVLRNKQWDIVRSLAEYDLHQDQVEQAVTAALDAKQSDLVLFLLDMQQLCQEDIQNVFHKALESTQRDLVLPLLERGATTETLLQDSKYGLQLTNQFSMLCKYQDQCGLGENDASLLCSESTFIHQLKNAALLSETDQWELLQEAVSQQKWHIVAQIIHKCSIGNHATVHHKLYPEALLQGQWGVIRALIKQKVKGVPHCYQAFCLELMQQGKWSIVGQVFQNCSNKNEDIFSEVLNMATIKQEWSTVSQLIQSGLSEEQRLLLFQIASHNGNWHIMQQLTKKQDRVGCYLSQYAFDIAATRSNWDMVCHYVKQGTDINYQDREGNTALHLATMQRDWEGVHKLMQLRPNINIMNQDEVTPLHLAAKNKAWDLVKVMIEHGGEICLQDKKKVTVLKYLLEAAQADVLQFAVLKGCNVMADSAKDRNAIHVLLSAGYYQTVVKMVELGANLQVINEGRTLLHFAVNRSTLSNMEACVSLCIDLGLSTHQPLVTDTHIINFQSATLTEQLRNSPTCLALRNKSVPFKVLWMLLESGASSYLELQRLKSWQQIKEITAVGTNGKQKFMYLMKTASRPQSLKQICRLAISHHIGCKGDRAKRIASLPLPRQLKDFISFSDILSVVKYQGKRML